MLLGGELRPFQRAGVAYVLDARRTFLADEQGLGKTVQALAALEADDAYPAIVVCPASLKLNWEREASVWLPERSVAVAAGTGGVIPTADITIINYDIVHAHRARLSLRRARALVLDESHYVKNPRARRTRAVRRLAEELPPDALRLALTGTPVMNHPDELIAQLRIIGRLSEFGSGARFSRRFQGSGAEERIHWHLRRTCFVRRAKREVLPQLPAKRQVVVPVALDNEAEYRRAEEDVIAWLREQPLDLRELDRKVAAALRAERLAQLNVLRRLAVAGKAAAALVWIEDFLASDEPLVVFSGHRFVQDRLLERFPDALHLVGSDSLERREEAVREFQAGSGPQLLVAATRVGGQGITLDARDQRGVPGSRVDAGDARPGRGPPAPHRPARGRHRLVPARGRVDRRDDGRADRAQAGHRRRGHRRPARRLRGAGAVGRAVAARGHAAAAAADRRLAADRPERAAARRRAPRRSAARTSPSPSWSASSRPPRAPARRSARPRRRPPSAWAASAAAS